MEYIMSKYRPITFRCAVKYKHIKDADELREHIATKLSPETRNLTRSLSAGSFSGFCLGF